MGKHTSGNWQIGHASSGQGPYDDGGDYPIYYLDEAGDMQIIAEVIRRTDTSTYQPTEANAKLVAAAPDLLEALQDTFAMIDEGLLIRDISKDAESDYVQRMLVFTMRLKKGADAIKKATASRS